MRNMPGEPDLSGKRVASALICRQSTVDIYYTSPFPSVKKDSKVCLHGFFGKPAFHRAKSLLSGEKAPFRPGLEKHCSLKNRRLRRDPKKILLKKYARGVEWGLKNE
jgi:hypothetical protein